MAADGDAIANAMSEEDAYAAVKLKYAEFTATETRVPLRGLPDAIDAAVYVKNKWPLIVDPTAKAARFMQYQNGAFVVASIPEAVQPETLRKRLVGCLANGRSLTLSFGGSDADVRALCQDGCFPEVRRP